MHMLRWLGLAALVLSTSVQAATLDMSNLRTVATFDQFGQGSNLLCVDGQLLFPETGTDSLLVRDLRTGASHDIALTLTRGMYVVGIGGTRYAVSDPYEDKIAIVDLSTGHQVSQYQYQEHFGPWHLAFYKIGRAHV